MGLQADISEWLQWSGADFIDLDSDTSATATSSALVSGTGRDADCYAIDVQAEADHQATPGSGDTVDITILATLETEYSTEEIAFKLPQLDTNAAATGTARTDPIRLPFLPLDLKAYGSSNAGTDAIRVKVRVTQHLGAA